MRKIEPVQSPRSIAQGYVCVVVFNDVAFNVGHPSGVGLHRARRLRRYKRSEN